MFEIYAHLREKGGVHEFRAFKEISQKVKPERGKDVKFTAIETAMIGGVEFEGRRKVIKLPNIFKDEPLSKAWRNSITAKFIFLSVFRKEIKQLSNSMLDFVEQYRK